MKALNGEIIKVYQVSVAETDRTGKVFGYFMSESVGLALSKGKGWYGSDGHATAVNVLKTSDGDLYLIGRKITDHLDTSQSVNDALKSQALAKLSKEEREALGV